MGRGDAIGRSNARLAVAVSVARRAGFNLLAETVTRAHARVYDLPPAARADARLHLRQTAIVPREIVPLAPEARVCRCAVDRRALGSLAWVSA